MNIIADFTYKDACINIGNFKYNANYYCNTSFCVEVVVNSFKGYVTFECDFNQFKKFVNDLEDIYNFKTSSVSFVDAYGSSIAFTIDKLGHIECECAMYSDSRRNQLKVSFDADQTALEKFLKQLKGFIKLLGCVDSKTYIK